jgi:hypothetical protein
MQKGLSLGQPYSVNGYPAALNPWTDGLRNLTGKVAIHDIEDGRAWRV